MKKKGTRKNKCKRLGHVWQIRGGYKVCTYCGKEKSLSNPVAAQESMDKKSAIRRKRRRK